MDSMDSQGPSFHPPAQAVIDELKGLLRNIYADFDVSRTKVRTVADKGRQLAEDAAKWPGGELETREYLEAVDGLERKINQTLDLKKLKEEGLVRAVKL
jgi:hypothetical protein